jgi:hypothetical protein
MQKISYTWGTSCIDAELCGDVDSLFVLQKLLLQVLLLCYVYKQNEPYQPVVAVVLPCGSANSFALHLTVAADAYHCLLNCRTL